MSVYHQSNRLTSHRAPPGTTHLMHISYARRKASQIRLFKIANSHLPGAWSHRGRCHRKPTARLYRRWKKRAREWRKLGIFLDDTKIKQ